MEIFWFLAGVVTTLFAIFFIFKSPPGDPPQDFL